MRKKQQISNSLIADRIDACLNKLVNGTLKNQKKIGNKIYQTSKQKSDHNIYHVPSNN